MKKTVWVWIGLVGLVIVGGVVVWLMLSTKSTPPSTDNTNTETTNTTTETTTPSTSEEPQSGEVAVSIKDMAFAPSTI